MNMHIHTITHHTTHTLTHMYTPTHSQSVDMKASAVELLEVMLEETNEKSLELVKEIAGALDIPALHDTLADFYELKNDRRVKRSKFDDEAERGLFRTYHVLVHLRDYKIPSTIKTQIGKYVVY